MNYTIKKFFNTEHKKAKEKKRNEDVGAVATERSTFQNVRWGVTHTVDATQYSM